MPILSHSSPSWGSFQQWLFANQDLWHPLAYGHAEGMGDPHNAVLAAEATPVRTHYLSLLHKPHSGPQGYKLQVVS